MEKHKKFSNHEIHAQILKAATIEKKSTFELLEWLHTIEERRIYSERGYSSVHAYVTQYLSYSDDEAHYRISAMRIAFRAKEITESLQHGKITLTNLAKLSTHAKQNQLSVPQTIQVLGQIENRSKREVEKILAPEGLVKAVERVVQKTKTQVEIKFTANEVFMRKLETLKKPGATLEETFEAALDALAEKERTKNTPKRQSPVPAHGATRRTRYIPIQVKHETKTRSGSRCEYVDPISKKRCDARHFLEFHHELAFAKNGSRLPENIRHFCKSHNLFAAIQDFGREKIHSHLGPRSR